MCKFGLEITSVLSGTTCPVQVAQYDRYIQVNAEEKKQWDFQMKKYNDAVSLEKQRIEAIKEIAISYYKSQPTSVNYNYIVR